GVNQPIILWNNPRHNEVTIIKDTKLNAILSFAAMLMKIDMSQIFQIDQLAAKTGYKVGETICLFDLMIMLGRFHKQ
ncbi:MAG: hypothetical protein K2L29_01930, partial [Duncaniella sp.]|nr:hypothetical protein [Duncaniella sp.]